MHALEMIEQCVRDKKLHLVPKNIAQNEYAPWYWSSLRLKMNQRQHTPLYEKDKK